MSQSLRLASRSRRRSSFSTASRMNSARRPGPASASMRSATPSPRRTSIAFTSNFGLPMRGLVADIAFSVKTSPFPISLIDTYPISFTLAIPQRSKPMTALTIFQDDDRFIIGPVAQSYGYSMTQGLVDAYSIKEAKALLTEARQMSAQEVTANLRTFWTDGRFEAACANGKFGAEW